MKNDSFINSLSVGIVGLGLGMIYAGHASQNSVVRRIAVCDSDVDRLSRAKQEIPKVAAAYSSIDKMLLHENLDMICIITPDHMHLEHAEKAFAAGCNVLITKPIACTIPEAKAIIVAQKKAGKYLMVGHEARFRPIIIEIHRLLQENTIGKIIHMRYDALSDKSKQFAMSPWYASTETGRTALVGTGIHEVDVLRFLMNKPIISASAFSNNFGGLQFHDAKTTSAAFQFDDGAIGEVTVSYVAQFPGGKNVMPFNPHLPVIIGTEGIIANGQIGTDDWRPIEIPRDTPNSFKVVMNSFIQSLLDKTPPPITGEDALASLTACVAADISARERRIVSPMELA